MDLKVERNDIAKMSVDVVVLPANWRLLVGTGASMALFEAAGREELEAECAMRFEEAKRKGQRLVPGVSILTRTYALPAKTIMHTIMPKWRDDDPRRCYEELCKSYASALTLADEAGFKSIAFPVLASGNNGFDPDLAIDIAVDSISRYQPKNLLSEAHLVTFDSGITQRIRNRGYQVEEAISQMHVLDQDVHQAQVVKGSEHWRERKDSNTNPLQEFADGGLKWMQEPENQRMILKVALAVADVVLPKEGTGGKFRDVLHAVAPFVHDGGGIPRVHETIS